jgi:hypothetical protein
MARYDQEQTTELGGPRVTTHEFGERAAVLAAMITALRNVGSWCGETHIQKSIYLLQNAGEVNLGYEFVLYKHGPYSFDLATDIDTLRSNNIVEFVVPIQGYGPSVQLTSIGRRIFDRWRDFVSPLLVKIDYIADWFGTNDVRFLERIATAHFVRSRHPSDEPYALASELRRLKPHISEPDALDAVRNVGEKMGALKGSLLERRAS